MNFLLKLHCAILLPIHSCSCKPSLCKPSPLLPATCSNSATSKFFLTALTLLWSGSEGLYMSFKCLESSGLMQPINDLKYKENSTPSYFTKGEWENSWRKKMYCIRYVFLLQMVEYNSYLECIISIPIDRSLRQDPCSFGQI